jgi:hypothetical protein
MPLYNPIVHLVEHALSNPLPASGRISVRTVHPPGGQFYHVVTQAQHPLCPDLGRPSLDAAPLDK